MLFRSELFKEINDAGVLLIKDSNEREKALSKYFNESDAKLINDKFEKSKLLQKAYNGFLSVVRNTKLDEDKKIELLASRKSSIDEILNSINKVKDINEINIKDNVDLEKMVNDVYSKKYNLEISDNQLNKLKEITGKISELKKGGKENSIEYGKAVSELGHLTDKIQKCLIKLNNRPILDLIIRNFVSIGCTNIHLVLGYRAKDIINFEHLSRELHEPL